MDMKILDTQGKYDSHFTPETLALLKPRFNDVVFPKPERKTIFLATVVKTEQNIPEAVAALAWEIEQLALRGVLIGHLAPLSVLQLAEWEGVPGGFCVFIYPVVKWGFDPHFSIGLNQDFYVQEGQVGKRIYGYDSTTP